MTKWEWNGAKWWKFDFHTHTPASSDYGKGIKQNEFRSRTPKEWLLDFMQANIDCVAITDHNTGHWVDKLKNALAELEAENAPGYRQLNLFPGVEISVYGGIHLLAILGCQKTTSDIDSLLGAIGFTGTKGTSDAVTSKSFAEVLTIIEQQDGIAIPAHVDGENGLFRLQGTTLSQMLDCREIYACELLDETFPKPQAYLDKKLSWTQVLGSDAHHPSGKSNQHYPGSHFTWVKMGLPNLEGLRLALLDGPLSVGRSDKEVGDPNQHASLVLESIEVSNARYMGRAQEFTLKLNPWLNTIVGGRGTGKSTLVEFLRLALRRVDELPDDLRPEFEKYTQVYPTREDGGLLTNNAEIRVIYRKDGGRFRIQWSYTGDLEPIEEEDNGEWRRAEGEVSQRFPIRLYSQKQIFHLAKTPLALLGVVDEAPEVDRRTWNERWRAEETKFLSLRAKVREIETGLTEEQRLRGELDDVKRKMAIFEKAGHTDVLKAFQLRRRQQQAVDAWEDTWVGAGDRLRQVAGDIVPDSLDKTTFNLDAKEDSQLHEHSSRVQASLEAIRKKVERFAEEVDQILAEWRKGKDASFWMEVSKTAILNYQNLWTKLAQVGAGDPSAYGELVQRRQIIEQRLKAIAERRKQVADLKKQADAALQEFVKIRQELTAARRKFLDKVLADNRYVRIQVIPYGAKITVESEFRKLLQREGRGFEKDIGSPDGGGLLGGLYSKDVKLTDFEQALSELKIRIRKIATGSHEPYTLEDQRFANHLGKLQPETFDRLDLWFPEDSLDVQYSPTGDGKNFRSIQEGSPGQKTAALLAFLLSYGEEPLVLDQPEDDLDNHLIYDLIVTQLREVKRHRQLIVVTHNPNIVVNGDAELVVALAVRNGETQMECEGSLQDKRVRDTICTVMEGGLKAFEQRFRRIALEGTRV
ncbi:MAG: TrlF family AAA-like ATPase [Nitrospirales bacterium]|nr:AAA family ATPase [Nitrospirales bacterium]